MFSAFSQTPLAYIITGLILVISLTGFIYKPLLHFLLFHPYEVFHGHRVYTIFTSALVHSNWKHLAFNVIMIYVLLNDQEQLLISDFTAWNVKLICISVFIVSVVLCNLITGWFKRNDFNYTSLGSSGAVFAFMNFAALYLPLDHGSPKFSQIIYGYYWAIGFLMITAILSFRKSKTNHKIHFWGAITGTILVVLVKPSVINEIVSHIK